MLNNDILNHSTYEKLLTYGTCSHKVINDISDHTISSYLTTIASNKDRFETTHSKIAIQALDKYLSNTLSDTERKIAIEEFRKFPAIQVADHIGLFYDSTNFLNNFLWNISLEKNDINYMFTSQCETVRAVQNVKLFLGPGFIELNENIYNIFGLTRNKLKNINIAAFDDCKFIFELESGKNNPQFPDILRNIIDSSQKPGYAPDVFHNANLRFWNEINYQDKRKMILFDRRFFSDVLAENIEQLSPFIDEMLFNNETRNSFLEIKNRNIESYENLVLRNTTDFFYLKKGEELIPLKIDDDGIFYEGRNGTIATLNGEALNANPNMISEALRNRDLYPDLVLSNIYGHILPKISAIGGTSQLEYLPIIKKILDEFLSKNSLSSAEDIEEIRKTDFGNLIGPSLITLDQTDKKFIENIDSNSDISGFKNSISEKRIGDVLNINFWNYFDTVPSHKHSLENTHLWPFSSMMQPL